MAKDEYLQSLLSTGEVILIDTRQHWMAALRFALRPIVILLIAAGLLILTQFLGWDSGILGSLSDLVIWIAVVLAVVAVIWLPIDLVRWYSRKYLLTNRRAMRMSGVLRKTAFDSSLEQINDIGMEQSLLGRTLGYADLTLYTASDTANETYDQLIDGVQFKKAVLDAKEAIRARAPLMELPPGFIVKGGRNEASMRAEGKGGVQPAPDDAATPAAAAGAATVAAAAEPEAAADIPTAPEPVAEPALVVEPEPELVAGAEVVAEAEPEAEATPWPAADAPAADAEDKPAT